MQLFNRNFTDNLLPFDGELYYYGPVFTSEEVANWYQLLLHQIPWKHDELIMFGKKLLPLARLRGMVTITFHTYTLIN